MNPNGLLWTVPCRPCLRCRSTGWRYMTERQIREESATRVKKGFHVKITDRDRALAAELVDLLTGDTNERDVKCVAIVLAAHRQGEQGRCGHRAHTGPMHLCALPAGHDGWHRANRDCFGHAPEWSP